MNINNLINYLNNGIATVDLFKDINMSQFLKSYNGGAYSFTPFNTEIRYVFTSKNFDKIKIDYQNNLLDKCQFLYLLELIDLLIEGDIWDCKQSLKTKIEQVTLNASFHKKRQDEEKKRQDGNK